MPLIGFVSPKGGVGKSTLAAHMAALLAARGHAVLALDLDPQNALRLHLGLSIREEAGFLAQLSRSSPLGAWRSAVRQTASGVRLLPFGHLDPYGALSLGQALFAEPELLAGPVREMLAIPGQVVVVDSPPGPSSALAAIAPLIDLMVVVLLADGGSAALLPQIASGRFLGRGTLATRAAERAVVVLNQLEPDAPLGAAVLDGAQQALGPRLLGVICRDPAVAEALADKRLLTEPGPGAADDLQLLAEAIIRRAALPMPGARGGGFAGLHEWGQA
jgi:cellulose synthase operon protein YhjQ